MPETSSRKGSEVTGIKTRLIVNRKALQLAEGNKNKIISLLLDPVLNVPSSFMQSKEVRSKGRMSYYSIKLARS